MKINFCFPVVYVMTVSWHGTTAKLYLKTTVFVTLSGSYVEVRHGIS
jgi:hypothetical protein